MILGIVRPLSIVFGQDTRDLIKLSVLMPAYKEHHGLRDDLWRHAAVEVDKEIMWDDCSNDATPEIPASSTCPTCASSAMLSTARAPVLHRPGGGQRRCRHHPGCLT